MRGAALAAAARGLFAPAAAHAEIRALIVAAAHYQQPGIASLEGPPNDAAALKSVLMSEGATDVVTLSDAEVTRSAIRQALQDLGARARPGDWVIFFYAGHGAQAKARDATEADGLDEFLVLPAFNLRNPEPEQFVLDNELRGWLVNFFAQNVNVLQIADACHSGTLNRAPVVQTRFKARQALNQPLSINLPEPPADPMARAPGAVDPKNLVYVGAAQDDQFALEGPLPRGDSPARGLLTYALEGVLRDRVNGRLAADRDGDGQLSLSEMAAALEVRTREYSGAQQWASAHVPPGNERSVVFQALAAPPEDEPPLRVKGADPEADEILSGKGPWASLLQGEPDLTWSARGGFVVDSRGDRIAEGLKSADDLAAVVIKQQALGQLYKLADERKLKVEVGPLSRGKLYHAGEAVDLAVSHPGEGFLTVFDLAGDGTVQLLYPLDGDGEGRMEPARPRTGLASTRAAAPFGVDHVVAVATPENPLVLRQALARMSGRRDAAAAAAAVRDQLKGTRGALAIGELYTAP